MKQEYQCNKQSDKQMQKTDQQTIWKNLIINVGSNPALSFHKALQQYECCNALGQHLNATIFNVPMSKVVLVKTSLLMAHIYC